MTAARLKLVLLPLVALLLVAGGFAGYFAWQHGARGTDRTLPLELANMRFAAGMGRVVGDQLTVTHYQQGHARLGSPPLLLDASRYALLSLEITPLMRGDERLSFFWRRLEDPEHIHHYRLPRAGRYRLSLRDHPQWQGTITQIGFYVEGFGPLEYRLAEIVLTPASFGAALGSIGLGWLHPEPRQHWSINLLTGGPEGQLLPLTLALVVALVLAGGWVRLGRRRQRVGSLWWVWLLAGWLLLDLQWLNSARRWAMDSYHDRQHSSQGEPGLGLLDASLGRYLEHIKALLPSKPASLLFLGGGEGDFTWLRSRYLLAPHNLLRLSGPPSAAQLRSAEYLLLMGPVELDYQGGMLRGAAGEPIPAQLLLDESPGRLYRLGQAMER